MKKKIVVKQKDLSDCGAACLASVAGFYDLKLPIAKIRQIAGTDKLGTNVLGMVEAAEKLGFQAKGAKGVINNLPNVPLPAIAHVVLKNGYQHYVVVYQISKSRIQIMDPADGKLYTKEIADFGKIWSGVIILLIPGSEFQTGSKTQSNTGRFWTLINPHKSVMLQALVGSALYTLFGLANSIYLQKIIDYVLVDNNSRLLNLLSIAMIVILSFQLFIGLIKSIIVFKTGQHIDARLILGYYKHLMQLPQRFFDTMRVGEVISRVNDAVKIRVFINDIASSLIVNVLIIIFSFLVMFVYYWKLALIVLSIVPVYLLIYDISNRVNKKWQRVLMENTASLEAQLVESINSAGTIKSFRIESFANHKTETIFIRLLNSIYKSGKKSIFITGSTEYITRIFTVIILWIGSYFVINQSLSPGELLSFYALIGYFTGPAASLIAANKSIQDALIAADRLFEIIDLELEEESSGKIALTANWTGNIEFQEVYFKYGNRADLFSGLNLVLNKNELTAIVGESGSGKSTITALLLKLYTAKSGKILIGGRDIKHMSANSLREIISVVPQQIDLFTGPISENIALGKYEPDLDKIIFISKLLGIDEFIEKLPDAYNSLISEHGANLSGGQKQRIAIARAFYQDPDILILDEPTSSLDPISEQKLHGALAWFKSKNKTIIIITHRLSAVKNCDRILVLKESRLAESGSHSELIAAKGHYAFIWEKYHQSL